MPVSEAFFVFACLSKVFASASNLVFVAGHLHYSDLHAGFSQRQVFWLTVHPDCRQICPPQEPFPLIIRGLFCLTVGSPRIIIGFSTAVLLVLITDPCCSMICPLVLDPQLPVLCSLVSVGLIKPFCLKSCPCPCPLVSPRIIGFSMVVLLGLTTDPPCSMIWPLVLDPQLPMVCS